MKKTCTLSGNSSFYTIIQDPYEHKQPAGVLYENNGITRANGLITSMYEKEGRQWTVLNDSVHIPIDKLYAVNSTFSSDYSEC